MLRIRNVFKFFMLVAILGMTTTGCIDDIDVRQVLPSGGSLKIAFSVDGLEGDAKSRATTETTPAERAIQDVYIIFFDKAGVCRGYGKGVAGESGILSINPANGLMVNEDYKTLIVGNVDNSVPSGYNSYVEYIAQLVHKYPGYEEFSRQLCTESECTAGYLPMYGEYIDGAGRPADFRVDEDGKVEGTVRFRRACARIEFVNEIPELKIKRVALCNRNLRGFMFHDGNKKSAVENYRKSDIHELSNPQFANLWQAATASNVFYVNPTTIEMPEKYDDRTLCFMIEAEKTVNDVVEKVYYRLNVAGEGESQEIKRNHSYKVTLTQLISEGELAIGWAYNPSDPMILEPVDFESFDNDVFTVEGFDPRVNTNANGCTPNPFSFRVRCQNDYYTRVVSDFDANVDAFITINAPENRQMDCGVNTNTDANTVTSLNAKFTNQSELDKLKPIEVKKGSEYSQNSMVYLNVFRTGPGDKPFQEKLKVECCRKSDGFVVKREELNVKIKTSCIIDDVILLNKNYTDNNGNSISMTSTDSRMSNVNYPVYLIPDRNQGSNPARFSAFGVKNKPMQNYNEYLHIKLGGNDTYEDDASRRGIVGIPTQARYLTTSGIHMTNKNGLWWGGNPFYNKPADNGEKWIAQANPWSPSTFDANPNSDGYVFRETYKFLDGSVSDRNNGLNWYFRVAIPHIKNSIASKYRLISLSDFKTKTDATGTDSYIGCYFPWFKTSIEQIYTPAANIKTFPFNPPGPPVFGDGRRGGFWDWKQNVIHQYNFSDCKTVSILYPRTGNSKVLWTITENTGYQIYILASERMLRMISDTEWAQYRSNYGVCWASPGE